MPKPNLVACYSMTGNTPRIADEVTIALQADGEEIRESHPRHGLVGMLHALFDAITRRQPPIESIRRDPSDYELLVLSGPIWAGRPASPARSHAHQHAAKRSPNRVCVYGRWPWWGTGICRTEQPVWPNTRGDAGDHCRADKKCELQRGGAALCIECVAN